MIKSSNICQKQTINEALSSKVYHFTYIENLYKMLKDGVIRLSSSLTNGGADDFGQRLFFLSLTRNKDVRQGFSHKCNVRIELDGDKLNNNFKGKAISYWGKSMGKNYYMTQEKEIPAIQTRTENEDRLFTNKPVLTDFQRYVVRIDILAGGSFDNEIIGSIAALANLQYHIKVYIYETEKDFNLQTDNCVVYDRNPSDLRYSNKDRYPQQTMFGLADEQTDTVTLLKSIFGIICCGVYQFNDPGLVRFIANTLKQYRLERYTKDVVNKTVEDLRQARYYPSAEKEILYRGLDNLSVKVNSDVYNRAMSIFKDWCVKNKIRNRRDLIDFKTGKVEENVRQIYLTEAQLHLLGL